MTTETCKVSCVGSFAEVSLWRAESPRSLPRQSLGRWKGKVFGNDAVIVARELKTAGVGVCLRLLNPTHEDSKVARSLLQGQQVEDLDIETGPRTRALCLEDAEERRTWIFSRRPRPISKLKETSADIVYIDCYEEFASYLKCQESLNCERAFVVANLSAISGVVQVPRIVAMPRVVQASIGGAMEIAQAKAYAEELRRVTNAETVVVTMGARGALLANRHQTWHAKPQHSVSGAGLGAGAVFSATLMCAILEGLENERLIQSVVERTTQRLIRSAVDDYCGF